MKRLKELYKEDIAKQLKDEFGYSNIHEVPQITKLSVNVGVGRIKDNMEAIKKIAQEMYTFTGQKPKICKSKKAISGFKLRQGEIIGLNLTLRGNRMYQFLEKLLYVAIPRIRDFRGLSAKGFDNGNNYTIGIKENIIFPEISYERIEDIYGLQIVVNTTAKTKKEAHKLLTLMGFPFIKDEVIKD